MRNIKTKKGFTLVEVSLSLVFVAILSLTVAFIINDTIVSYRRGMTLKQINTVGTDLVDDMRAAIQNSSAKSLIDDCTMIYSDKKDIAEKCEENGARNFVTIIGRGKVKDNKSNKIIANDIPIYGAFCTGTYSYIWNSGYFEENVYVVDGVGGKASVEFKFENVEENDYCEMDSKKVTMTCSGFRLLKIEDGSRAVCASVAGDKYDMVEVTGNFDITEMMEVVTEEPIDLLASDEKDGGLAIYDLYASTPAESTTKNNLFYSVSFILGTVQGGINITKSGSFCATPDDYAVENFDYCAINKFNFAAQATGG